MVGRRLLAEGEAVRSHFADAASARRRAVLRETIAALQQSNRYHACAAENLARWRAARTSASSSSVLVLPGDWGEVTQTMTRSWGECFAVLNMANAYSPGGAYTEGAIAQEENMFRRSDCHFHIDAQEYDEARDRYRPETTRLLSAADGRVYLDVVRPRVCIRGAEDRARDDLGYAWLADDEVFPFFELRAAAEDLRDGRAFDAVEMRKRIAAQLDTLRAHDVRHAVLGAFGCGAFRNPAHEVAAIYRDELAARAGAFDVVAFAIFSAGYGPDNYTPFATVFAG